MTARLLAKLLISLLIPAWYFWSQSVVTFKIKCCIQLLLHFIDYSVKMPEALKHSF